MEYGRVKQCEDLQAQGWVIDKDCSALQQADQTYGGPTYMRHPTDGRIYAVSHGQELPLEGQHQHWIGDGLGSRVVVYVGGKPIARQG